jgi:hypothetical protein
VPVHINDYVFETQLVRQSVVKVWTCEL